MSPGFNPSVGILLVWTGPISAQGKPNAVFQSLGRDSVGLDQFRSSPEPVFAVVFQSLGRDSVGLDLGAIISNHAIIIRFNPSVGILLVWTTRNPQRRDRECCFNPSVGILLVWTRGMPIE